MRRMTAAAIARAGQFPRFIDIAFVQAPHLIDQPDPDIRIVRPGRAAGGSDWIGLRRNESYTVAGINQLPLLPGILVALAFLMAMGSAWWREGR